jgi:phosphoribosylformimino-5-aminoimidazole carboxamide ribonucleotide (ProFAR) isomerase
MAEEVGGVFRGKYEALWPCPEDQAGCLPFIRFRIAAEALKCVSTSLKVGGGIRCRVSIRSVSHAGAGIGFSVRCFLFNGTRVRIVLSNIGIWRLFVNIGHGLQL